MKKPLSFGATMLASALGVVIVSLVGGLLTFIMMIGMVVAVGNMGSDEPTEVKNHTILTLDLGSISGDRTQSELMQAFGEGRTVGLIDAVGAVRRAATDEQIEGIWIKDNGMSQVSWASMEELRAALVDFGKSGKPVVSYASGYSQTGYYVASVANRVALHPSGMVDLRGLGAEVMYYKDMLDKLGVEMQLIRPESCAYKSAGEVYTMNHMSEANREQIRAYRASIWRKAVAEMAESRHLSEAEINRLADHLTGYLATDALQAGVVDTLCFEEDVKEMLREECGGKHLVSIADYVAGERLAPNAGKDRIAVVYAEGNVMDGHGHGWDEGVFGDDIVKALKQASENDDVKAIVLRINSPGGMATASESMTHAVMKAREKKPVVVSMGDVAASAGYEMACMANCIVAQPMTVTGSIGVFGTVPNVQRLMRQKLGLTVDTVATNRNATGLSVFRPLSPTAMRMMTRNVEDFYKVFVGRVATGRQMSYDEVHRVARGRVWSGADALRIGLVDTLGGLDVALAIAADKAGVESYRIKSYPTEKDTWTQLLELFGNEEKDDLNLLAKMRLAWKWHLAVRQVRQVERIEADLRYVATSEGVQARLPFVVVED